MTPCVYFRCSRAMAGAERPVFRHYGWRKTDIRVALVPQESN